jgi:pyroglutamyl-peptidase
MPVLLLTGFRPWGDHAINPSQQLVQAAHPPLPPGWSLRTACLPVSWKDTVPAFFEALTPDTGAILAFGLAARRRNIQPERFARNAASGPDGEGQPPPSITLADGGPPRRSSTLPVDNLVAALNCAGLRAEVSEDAGDYLCNALSYAFLGHITGLPKSIPAGFIHLPPEEWLGPEERLRALNIIVATTLGR